MLLKQELIKLPIVKGAELPGQATERSDKPELRGDDINDQTKPYLLRKRKAGLGFTLHLSERISGREQVRAQVGTTVRRKREIAGLVRSLKRPTHQITASLDMFRPWHDLIC
jgi:hypothetical protein